MIVVSNTSPLTNLAAIGQFDLLHRLYPDVNITNGVWDELNAMENRWPGGEEVAAARWMKRYSDMFLTWRKKSNHNTKRLVYKSDT